MEKLLAHILFQCLIALYYIVLAGIILYATFIILHTTQLLVQLVNCDWQVVIFPMKEEWRYV